MFELRVCPAATLALIACSCATGTPLIFKTLPAAGAVYGARLVPRLTHPPCAGAVRDRLPEILAEAWGRNGDCAATLAHPLNERSALGRGAGFADATGVEISIQWQNVQTALTGRMPGERIGNAGATSAAMLIKENVSVQLDQAPEGWDRPGKVTLNGSAALALLPAAALLLACLVLAAGLCGHRFAHPARGSTSCWW